MTEPRQNDSIIPSSPAAEGQGDEREWTLIWHDCWHASGPTPICWPGRYFDDDGTIPVVPKSTLTTERHRVEKAERDLARLRAFLGAVALQVRWSVRAWKDEPPATVPATWVAEQIRAALATSQEEA